MARGGSVGIDVVEDLLLLLCFDLSAEFIEGGVVVRVVGVAAARLCRRYNGLVHDSFLLFCGLLVEEIFVVDDFFENLEEWAGIFVVGQDNEVLPFCPVGAVTTVCKLAHVPFVVERVHLGAEPAEDVSDISALGLLEGPGEGAGVPGEAKVMEALQMFFVHTVNGFPENNESEAEVLNDDGVTVVVEGEVEVPGVLLVGGLDVEHTSETVGRAEVWTVDNEEEVLFVVGECGRAIDGFDAQESHGVDCDVTTFVQELVVCHLGRFFCSCKPCVAIYEG